MREWEIVRVAEKMDLGSLFLVYSALTCPMPLNITASLPTFSNFLDLNQGQIRRAVTWYPGTSGLQLHSDAECSPKNLLVPQVLYNLGHGESSLSLCCFSLGVMSWHQIGQMLSGNQDVN